MADIRKRTNADGSVGYQVRFIDKSKKSGFGYKTFLRAKQAQQFKTIKDLEEGSLSPSLSSDLSVPDAIDSWLDICERVGRDGREPVEPTTLYEYTRRAGVMRRYNWQKPLAQLQPTDVVQFRTWLLENVSRDLARRTLSSFGSALTEMVMQGHLLSNPAIGISVRTSGRYEDDQSEIDIPSDEEVRTLLSAVQAMGRKNDFMEKAWERYRPMIYLPIFTGLRMSEVRGLPWSSVAHGLIKVTQRADAYGEIGVVKSKAARRSIEVAGGITDELIEWKERCPANELDLVFPTTAGRPINLHNFRDGAWNPLFKEAGLLVPEDGKAGETVMRPKYTPHCLRHYYASKLIEKGKDLKFIQSRMGHSRIETTLNIYGHLMKNRDEEHKLTAQELADELL